VVAAKVSIKAYAKPSNDSYTFHTSTTALKHTKTAYGPATIAILPLVDYYYATNMLLLLLLLQTNYAISSSYLEGDGMKPNDRCETKPRTTMVSRIAVVIIISSKPCLAHQYE